MYKLYVGAGKSCIDPTPDMYPMPTRFGVTDAIYDSCYCRAIAIDNGSKKILLVVFELSDIPTVPQLKEQIAAHIGFNTDDVFIIFTHNHSSPCDEANTFHGHADADPSMTEKREKYKRIELSAALDAAKQAVSTMRPAHCGFGTIDSYVNVNRDYQTMHGYWVEAPDYSGYSDKTLAALKFTDDEGKLIAALLNHGTHSTCIFLQRDSDHLRKTSGNFSGIASKFAEKHFEADGAVVAWTAGAAGNQDPIMSHGLQYEYPDGYTTSVPYPDGTGYMQMEFIGRRHGADAVKCLHSINDDTNDLPINHEHCTIWLPGQKRTVSQDGKRINPRMGGNGLRDEAQYPYGTVPELPDLDSIVAPDDEHPVRMEMHLITLGDTALLLTNGELYAELGREIKAISPFKNTVVITYATAASTSYIVDSSSTHHKVFQAFGPVAPGKADNVILSGAAELFAKAHG